MTYWQQLLLLFGVAIVATALAAIIGLTRDFPPAPEVHDEFGILLAADTYASGRLTNPPHPMARFFDTIYVIQQPTYMGKYPPVQALMLALGKVLTGEFIIGAWISCGIMAAAILWMLQALLSMRWALYGTLIAVLQIGILSYWTHSYWGSTMAVAAGAVVLGGTVRLLRHASTLHAVVTAVGLLVLANSRPYDGLAASIPPLIALLYKAWASCHEARIVMVRKVFLPAAAVLALGVAWMGYNNFRVTGDVLRLPYSEHTKQYMIAPAFLWQSLRTDTPTYSHEVLRTHHAGWEVEFYLTQRSLASYITMRARFFTHAWAFYLNWILTIPFCLGIIVALKAPYRLATFSMLAVFAAVMVTTWGADRFFAPVGAVFFLLITCGTQLIVRTTPKPLVRYLIAGAFPVLILVMTFGFGEQVITPAVASRHPLKTARVQLLDQLRQIPGDDLVFVRSTAALDSYFEWVYNSANIDEQDVIFARFHSWAENEELIRYYPYRHVWLLDASGDHATGLRPYNSAREP